MPEKKYVADFLSLCVERVADNTAFVTAAQLHDCFIAYMAAKHPCANRISGKVFSYLLRSCDGMDNLLCRRVFWDALRDEIFWGFKKIALSPAAKKILEASK